MTNERLWANRSGCSEERSRPWANHSGCSRQMSDHEWFAQVAQRKWLNEQFTQKNLAKKSKILFCYVLFKVKKNIRKNERMAHFCSFPLFWWVMWVNRSFCSNQMCCIERIAHFAHQKWGNEWIANFFEWISHLLIFGQKRAFRLEIKWANSQPWRKAGVLTDNEPNYLIRIVISPIIAIFLAIILTKL